MERVRAQLDDAIARALREDLAERGDVTTQACVPSPLPCRARIVAKATGVFAGHDVVVAGFRAVDAAARVDVHAADGDRLAPGDVVAEVEADAAAVLAAERTILNLIQRASGAATVTRAFVDAVEGTRARILDTRKTTPGLRVLDRIAVAAGGGENHRLGLFDQILIKENHFALARPLEIEAVVRAAVDAAATVTPGRPVVAEARDLPEALAVVRGGAGVVLLDNFAPDDELRRVVAAVRAEAPTVEIEVSGGVTLDSVAAFAHCDVDRISVGSLTHSAPALDLSLLVEPRT